MLLGLLTFAPSFGGAVIAAQAAQRGWYPIVHSVEVDLVWR